MLGHAWLAVLGVFLFGSGIAMDELMIFQGFLRVEGSVLRMWRMCSFFAKRLYFVDSSSLQSEILAC